MSIIRHWPRQRYGCQRQIDQLAERLELQMQQICELGNLLGLIIMHASRRGSHMKTRRHVNCNHRFSPLHIICVCFEIAFITSGYFNRNINISLLVVKRAFYGRIGYGRLDTLSPRWVLTHWMWTHYGSLWAVPKICIGMNLLTCR